MRDVIPKHQSTHNQNENYDGNDGMIDMIEEFT